MYAPYVTVIKVALDCFTYFATCVNTSSMDCHALVHKAALWCGVIPSAPCHSSASIASLKHCVLNAAAVCHCECCLLFDVVCGHVVCLLLDLL